MTPSTPDCSCLFSLDAAGSAEHNRLHSKYLQWVRNRRLLRRRVARPPLHFEGECAGCGEQLYHRNAEEETEMPAYPSAKDFPLVKERSGPRGVLHCYATNKDDPTEQPRWGRVGKPPARRGQALLRLGQRHHMHMFAHTKQESLGQAVRWQSRYHDTRIDHDENVGELLDYLDQLGITEDTVVMYSSDNGPHMNSWPDGARTPFRSEKNTNWEGAFRVPLLLRCPPRSSRAVSRTTSCNTTTGYPPSWR